MAEYIDFEADVSGDDFDNDDIEMSNDDDNYFINDVPIEEEGSSFYVFVNQKLDPKKVLEECVEGKPKLMENMDGSNYNFWGNEFEEKIDDFEGSKKRFKKFEENLLNPVDPQTRENSVRYALIYSIRYQKNKKKDSASDDILSEEIGKNLFDNLKALQKNLILDLDYSNFEKTCYSTYDY